LSQLSDNLVDSLAAQVLEIKPQAPNNTQQPTLSTTTGVSTKTDVPVAPTTATFTAVPTESTGRIAKLSPFSRENTKVWFEVAEQILASECRTDSQAKLSLLKAIGSDVLREAGIDTVSYNWQQIRDQILRHFGDTREKQLREFLSTQQLGDQKPTTLLRTMLSQAEGYERLVRMRFLEVMPKEVRICLVGNPNRDLEELGKLADDMMEQFNIRPIASVSQQQQIVSSSASGACASSRDPIINQLVEDNRKLQEQLKQLTESVNNISFQARQSRYDNNTNTNRPRSNSRGRSPSRGRFNPKGPLCYYHFNFRQHATRCDGNGCKWKNNNQKGNSNTPSSTRHGSE
jgi:predicted transcriptional regulator